MIVWGHEPPPSEGESALPLVLAAVLWLVLLTGLFPAAWDQEAEHETRAREAHIAGIDR